MINRHLGKAAAALTLAALCLPIGAHAQDAFGPTPATPAAQSFKLGKLQLIALHDAQVVFPNNAKIFGVDAGAAAVSKVLQANGLPTDRITVSLNALIVRDGHHIVLLDTGLGPKAHGSLMGSLNAAGIAPGSVTDVLITHSHGDHVGGLLDAAGNDAFPNATIRMSAVEWQAMKGRTNAADMVKAISSHVVPFTPGKPILPGITPLASYGHTKGHVGYQIVSGKQKLFDIGDTVHSSIISLAKPDWAVSFDGDKPEAEANRAKTLSALVKSHELIFAPHFPFPGVGYIKADGDHFKWDPTEKAE